MRLLTMMEARFHLHFDFLKDPILFKAVMGIFLFGEGWNDPGNYVWENGHLCWAAGLDRSYRCILVFGDKDDE